MSDFRNRLTRRDVMSLLLLSLAGCSGAGGAGLGSPPLSPPPVGRRHNAIQDENRQLGDSTWRITRKAGDDVLAGYASAVSASAGEQLDIMVSTSPAQPYSISFYRMGYYGGAGARRMMTVDGLQGSPQPPPTIDPNTRMVSCQWSPSYRLTVPASWLDGIYIAKLTNAAGFEHCIRFAVRDDSRQAIFLYQQPVLTYQAYNLYPGIHARGKNLYTGYGDGPPSFQDRSLQVSFNRPYSISDNVWHHGAGLNWETSWERYFVNWVEAAGVDVTYSTDIDTHLRPWRLLQVRGVLSAGHNEYWTSEMMDAWIAARDRGVSLGFLGANAAYWRVILDPPTFGAGMNQVGRVVRCAKDPAIDPLTIKFRDLGRAEQQLVGVQYVTSGFPELSDFVVKNSNHWAYANTGLRDGDRLIGVLGYEVDSLQPRYPQPKFSSYADLGDSRFLSATSNASLYQAPSGALVFAAGTLGWTYGLGKPGADPRVGQITANVLNAFAPH